MRTPMRLGRLTAAASAAALMFALTGCGDGDDPEQTATANTQTTTEDETSDETTATDDATTVTEDATSDESDPTSTDAAETGDGTGEGEGSGSEATGTAGGEGGGTDAPGDTNPPPVGGGENPAPPVPVEGGEGSEGASGATYGAPVRVTVGNVSVNMPGNWTQSPASSDAPDGTIFYGPGGYDSGNGLILGPVEDMEWSTVEQITSQNRPPIAEGVDISVPGADKAAAYYSQSDAARATAFLLIDDEVFRVQFGVPQDDFDEVKQYIQTISVG